MDTMVQLMPQLLVGLLTALKMFIFTLVLSIPLGIVVALFRTSKLSY